MVETFSPLIMATMGFFLSAITLFDLAVLQSGAQSVIINRDARRSDGLDKYKGVR